MKRAGLAFQKPGLWLALLAIGAVLVYVLSGLSRTAPGPLSTVHGREPKLQGFGSCNQCHGGWFSDMRSSCLECHEAVQGQLERGEGLHGKLGNERTGNCALCHGEHHGEGFAVTNKQSFALAGIADVQQFDHALVSFDLGGSHLALACNRCHLHAETQPLPQDQQRYLGLQPDCAACHRDAHQGRMQRGCAECHGQASFQRLEAKDHDRVLPLVGGHGGLACSQCHQDGGPHALEQLGQHLQSTPRQCQDCHESPHRQPFVAGNAALQKQPEKQSCAGCHRPDHRSFRAPELQQLSAAQHAASGFPLAAPHDKPKCADCHDAALPFAQRHPGRDLDTCSSCHRDVHQGQFRDSPVGRRGCLGCHDRLHWKPPAFDVAAHQQTSFPLTGRHRDTACDRCHDKPGEAEPRRFHGTKGQCADCHHDVHAGRFVAAAPAGEPRPAVGCEQCHDTQGFDRLPPSGFDHGRWTGFAVAGAHAQAACESCHPRTPMADRHHRSFGRVAEAFGEFQGCRTCHRDPHEGGFDKPELPARVDGRGDCARCHVETSFRALDLGFDHGRWTGFELAGKHAQVDCEACHAPLLPATASGRTWQRAAGNRCADCHRDSHAGQFEVAGHTDCRRCHKTAERFADLSFRHDLDSRFPLGEPHEKLACNACHKPARVGAIEAVRYRPIPFQCADCHGAQNDPLHRPRVKRR